MSDLKYSKGQMNSLVILRIFIGWHLLYEGVLKLYNPSWTAKGYLMSSEGFMKGMFQWLAGDSLVGVVDALNIVILVGVGVALLLGFWTRIAALAGCVLLLLYYFSHPALPGFEQGPVEGSYWLINKNLIEAAAMVIIFYFPTSKYFGLESLFEKKKSLNQTVI